MTTGTDHSRGGGEHARAFADLADRVPTGCYIGGQWRASSDGSLIEVADPSTGEVLTSVANGTVVDGTLAVDAAAAAMPA
jgi:succinate-semialdehyde dehydrogenase/glutarate-semialdehyde dehydrogenase